MAASIPASAIVRITPDVINAGGTGLSLSGLILTGSNRVPIGQVYSFATAVDVAAFFGGSSDEATAATVYFAGFDGSTVKPAALLFATYPVDARAAYLRSGPLGLTLTQLQALTGVLTININGTPITSSTITLSGATSFSNAATLIQAAFSGTVPVVTYDSVLGEFSFKSPTVGMASTMSFATGSLSVPLSLTQATGAVLSPQSGANPDFVTYMNGVTAVATNFATVTTLFEPDTPTKVTLATWVNTTNRRFAYVMWDSDTNATTIAPTTTAVYLIKLAQIEGVLPIYTTDFRKAAFVMGLAASLDYTQPNGRATFAFKSQAGLTADVTDQTTANRLQANGYNYYGAYATAAQGYVFFYPGSITGEFLWADSYVNQIQLNSAFQVALMDLLSTAKSIPYTGAGYAQIETALSDSIEAALAFGTIRAGVPLTNAQRANVDAVAGLAVADTVASRGWYLSIRPAVASVRAARGSPPCAFLYTDGGSIQRLDLTSVEVI